jgi:hypothetical protein
MRQASAIIEFDPEPAADRPRVLVLERADPIPADRLREIAESLLEYAARTFADSRVSAVVEPESDEESFACHRIVITADVDAGADPEGFVRDEFSVYRYAAQTLNNSEFQAVRLAVQPSSHPIF